MTRPGVSDPRAGFRVAIFSRVTLKAVKRVLGLTNAVTTECREIEPLIAELGRTYGARFPNAGLHIFVARMQNDWALCLKVKVSSRKQSIIGRHSGVPNRYSCAINCASQFHRATRYHNTQRNQ